MFPERLDAIARDKGIDRDRIEVWFGDEARIGQKNKITRRWARRGTRPSAPHDQRTASTYLFGAIRPARLQHRGDEPAPRRNRRRSGSRQARRSRRRPGRMAPLGRPRGSRQHHARGAPAQMPGAQPRRERLADRMFVAEAEVARPALCDERGLRRMDRRRASRRGDERMHQDSAVFVGLDASKLKISVALAEDGRQGEVRFLGDIEHTPGAVRRLVTKLAGKYRRLLFCYEAGPTGYGLQRQISDLGHDCAVIAPSLIPKRPGERVKTNRRDALTLARLHRAGELTAIWVPDPGHEAVRDLVRAREAAMEDLREKRQHLQAFLLRSDDPRLPTL